MKKFWQWMEKNGYGTYTTSKYKNNHLVCFDIQGREDGYIIHPTKQMIIGYMIEYINNMEHLYQLCSCSKSIDELYDCLEKIINKLRDS